MEITPNKNKISLSELLSKWNNLLRLLFKCYHQPLPTNRSPPFWNITPAFHNPIMDTIKSYFLFFLSANCHMTVKLNALRMLFQVVLRKGNNEWVSECMKEKQSKGRRTWKSPTGNITHFICITTLCSPVAEQDHSCWISTAPEPFDWSRSTDWRPSSVCLSARVICMCAHTNDSVISLLSG